MLHYATFFDVFRVELDEDTVKRSVLCDGLTTQHYSVLDIVDAKIFGVATSYEEITEGWGHSNRIERLVLGGIFRCIPVFLKPSSSNIVSAFEETFDVAGFTIPDEDLSSKCARDQFVFASRTELADNYFR